jgi:hypothetical protein
MLIDDDEEPSIFEKIFYLVEHCLGSFFNRVKYGFQKLICPYHASDLDLWNLSRHMGESH